MSLGYREEEVDFGDARSDGAAHGNTRFISR